MAGAAAEAEALPAGAAERVAAVTVVDAVEGVVEGVGEGDEAAVAVEEARSPNARIETYQNTRYRPRPHPHPRPRPRPHR